MKKLFILSLVLSTIHRVTWAQTPQPEAAAAAMARIGNAAATAAVVVPEQPARVSCNAAFSAPCARTNSEYLARFTAASLQNHFRNHFENAPQEDTDVEKTMAEAINSKAYNMDTGFYPFVFRKDNAKCIGHGVLKDLVGLTIQEIFHRQGIAFSNATALHERFVAASNKGGDFVQYLWNDGGGEINSKIAYVVPLDLFHNGTTTAEDSTVGMYYLGVGYENKQLPPDLPCSARYDSFCSITNVRSLVGAAQFRLNQAESLENFEAGLYELSYDKRFVIVDEVTSKRGTKDEQDDDAAAAPEDFYVFVYSYSGNLMAHGINHHSFGMDLGSILWNNGFRRIEDKEVGANLHKQFIEAADSEEGSGWVQYWWRNRPDEEAYLKIAFIVKIEFEGELYYLGSGFRYATMMDDIPSTGPLGSDCDATTNLPCAFRTVLQLSSHALSHALSSPLLPGGASGDDGVQDMFDEITHDEQFKIFNFYVFFYDFNNTCVAHGLNETFVGKSLNEVFQLVGINSLNATALHHQFVQAAKQGGGFVLYDWLVPNIPDSDFQKISYIFRLNIGGRDYYGGVGLNHQRAPTETHVNGSFRHGSNMGQVVCTSKYNFDCSEINARAVLGQALAALTLATSEAHSSSIENLSADEMLENVLMAINNGEEEYRVNDDFFTMVVSVDGAECEQSQDGSGCILAHGKDPSMVGKTLQQFLEAQGITSVTGVDLHRDLTEASNLMGADVIYPYSSELGGARFKKAWAARFRNGTRSFYVISEILLDEPPPTCDACPDNMECTQDGQSFCEEKTFRPIDEPGIKAVVSIFCILLPLLIMFFIINKRNSKRRALERIQVIQAEKEELARQLDEQMVGMVEVSCNMPIMSPDQYRQKVRVRGLGVESSDRYLEEALWYWEEDQPHLGHHKPDMILKDSSFVGYSSEVSGQIEHSYRLWKDGHGLSRLHVDLSGKITSTATGTKANNASTGASYEIDFERLIQRNALTNHQRNVRREIVDVPIDPEVEGLLPPLPEDIDFSDEAEHLLPVFIGQVIQVSKAHPNGLWLFGNVLYDPLVNSAIENHQSEINKNTNIEVLSGSNNGTGTATINMNDLIANILRDRPTSGWFPKSITTPANIEVMQKLLSTMGNDGLESLQVPETWDESSTQLQQIRVLVDPGTREYEEVKNFFIEKLYSLVDVKVKKIERIQNKALWQTYSVKKQTMKLRDSSNPHHIVNNHGDLERRWLFHGTKSDVIPQIISQGFNRAFAGRNAVYYGKGVYFARDSSYSCSGVYASEDSSGLKRMFLCRVACGDWCRGTNGQLTPDPKPHNSLELFDSTVDNVQNPSIFVVYHDAQAYPEYLVEFKIVNKKA